MRSFWPALIFVAISLSACSGRELAREPAAAQAEKPYVFSFHTRRRIEGGLSRWKRERIERRWVHSMMGFSKMRGMSEQPPPFYSPVFDQMIHGGKYEDAILDPYGENHY